MKIIKVILFSFMFYVAQVFAEDVLVSEIVSTTDNAGQTRIIEQILKDANAERETILKMGAYKEYQVYRDGANYGVIYEYTVVDNKSVTINPQVKSKLVTSMRAWFTSPEMKPALNEGFYIKFVYKKSDGTVLHDFTINKSDF